MSAPIFRIKSEASSFADYPFYYPEILIDGEWRCLNGNNQGVHILSAEIVDYRAGWKDKEMAQAVIDFYKQNSQS